MLLSDTVIQRAIHIFDKFTSSETFAGEVEGDNNEVGHFYIACVVLYMCAKFEDAYFNFQISFPDFLKRLERVKSFSLLQDFWNMELPWEQSYLNDMETLIIDVIEHKLQIISPSDVVFELIPVLDIA